MILLYIKKFRTASRSSSSRRHWALQSRVSRTAVESNCTCRSCLYTCTRDRCFVSRSPSSGSWSRLAWACAASHLWMWSPEAWTRGSSPPQWSCRTRSTNLELSRPSHQSIFNTHIQYKTYFIHYALLYILHMFLINCFIYKKWRYYFSIQQFISFFLC